MNWSPFDAESLEQPSPSSVSQKLNISNWSERKLYNTLGKNQNMIILNLLISFP